MTHRRPKLPLAPRLIAAGCVVLWLTGISACDLEALTCCNSHGNETMAHADQEHSPDTKDVGTNDPHDADAHHSDTANGHSPDSQKQDSREDSCCSALKSVVPIAKPVVLGQPTIHPLLFHCVRWKMPATSFALTESLLHRPAESCDRVFSPEVCLGPAHRSLAPPAIRLI